MGSMLVFSNAVEGRDDDYTKWYDEFHLNDILSVPSFTSGKRYLVSEVKGLPQTQGYRYLAVYKFEGSPQAAFENMGAAMPNFRMTDALDPNVLMAFVEDL